MLTKLVPNHAYDHAYYVEHFYEIHKALPTSLTWLDISFQRKRPMHVFLVVAPPEWVKKQRNGEKVDYDLVWNETIIFSRLIRLVYLRVWGCMGVPHPYRNLPPLPQSLVVLDTYVGFRAKELDRKHIPPSLRYANIGVSSGSDSSFGLPSIPPSLDFLLR